MCFCFQSATDLSVTFILYDPLCISSSLMWPYFFCHVATVVTEQITSIGDIVYESNWFDYPAELRKYNIYIIIRSQEPILFTGLKIIKCSKEVFLKVSILFRFNINIQTYICLIQQRKIHSTLLIILFFSLKIFKASCSYYLIFTQFSQH